MGNRTILGALVLASIAWLAACDDAAPGGCVIFDQPVAVGATIENFDACLRCVCQGPDQPGCSALPACERDGSVRPTDRGVRDRGAVDAGRDAQTDAATDGATDATGALDGRPPGDDGPTCTETTAVCVDEETERVCVGGAPVTRTCPPGQRCLPGGCIEPSCAPGGRQCNLGRVVFCDEAGFPVRSEACPSGQICLEGECLGAEPNVVLLVDTSGSMASAVRAAQEAPFPACEDAIEPYTRLGVVKLALDRLFASNALDQLRLALLRFPQNLSQTATCPQGHQRAANTLSELGSESLPFDDAVYARLRRAMLTVPIERSQLGSDRPRLASWVDFGERLGEVGPDCRTDCEGICGAQDECLDVVDPELRPDGATPLGRSLAFAGEYLQREIWRDGRPCVEDADCDSPHYECRQQVCTDLLGSCRGQVVVMFTDGGETADPNVGDWYHPATQARRMAVGLGCNADADCGRGAACVDNECTIGRCSQAQLACHPVNGRCPGDEPCVPMLLRSPGFGAGQRFVNPDGTTHDIQVHVVDVSGAPGNDQIAWWGTGRYLRVEELEADGLVQVFTPLLEAAKDETLRCIVER